MASFKILGSCSGTESMLGCRRIKPLGDAIKVYLPQKGA